MPWDAPGSRYDQASCEEGGPTQKDENTAQNFLRAGQAITQSAAAGEEDKLTLPLALLASPRFSQVEIFLRSLSPKEATTLVWITGPYLQLKENVSQGSAS